MIAAIFPDGRAMNPRAFVLASITATVLAVASAHAQRVPTVAMVTDLSGPVKLEGAKGQLPPGIATELPADARIEVAAGGRVVILVLATGAEYTLSGPVSAQVRADGLTGAPAERLVRRTSAVGKVKLRGEGLAQAAVTLRSSKRQETLPLLNLTGTTTLENRPVFRWSAVEGAGPYRFELQDANGTLLHEARTEATELRLPESIALVDAKAYTWEVTARQANGMRFSNFGDFTIATAALRAEAARLKPPQGAGVSERVAYATWLASQDLNDEARAVWAQLAAERPDNSALKALSER
jgi:hypothetical protein